MKKAFKFTMEPEETDRVVQYLIIDDAALEEEMADDPEGFFAELDNGRHPGYVLTEWQRVDVDKAKNNYPYTLD